MSHYDRTAYHKGKPCVVNPEILCQEGFCADCELAKHQNLVNWITETCPYCGRLYSYPEDGYHPKSCSDIDCVHKSLHHSKVYLQ